MANLEKQTRELMEEAGALFDACMKNVGFNGLLEMSDDDLDAIKHCMKMYQKANELAIAQAKALDDMNEKLDKLLIVHS